MKDEANERRYDETFDVSRKCTENCREKYERSCSEKNDLSRRNTFIVTDLATNRCMAEKRHMAESMEQEMNAKVKISENFTNSKQHHFSSKSTELKHMSQPSKKRSKISALTTWPDQLTTSDDHLTTPSDHLTTLDDHLTSSSDHTTNLDESQMSDARLSNLPVTRINCFNCHNSKPSDQHNNNNCVTSNMEKIREEVRTKWILFS